MQINKLNETSLLNLTRKIKRGKRAKTLEQLIKTIILGIIQGLTEWLPISSTGHLKMAEHFLNFFSPEDSLIFEFTLHIGTLIVALLFFREDIKKLVSALFHLDFKTEHGKLIPPIVVGTISAAAIGIALKRFVEQAFQSLTPLALAFILCGTVLYSTKTSKEKTDQVGYSAAIIIGAAEGLSIIPGISRSGITIAAALLLGIKREKAFRFSFLLSIPAIIGALSLEFSDVSAVAALASLGWIEIVAGVVAAMVVGYFALKLLWKILTNRKFHLFAIYCWILGIALIAVSIGAF
ncbi:MAG: undecaprenyl-diphosphate phosphatase [Candidatus Bathyarchaeia archaeon]